MTSSPTNAGPGRDKRPAHGFPTAARVSPFSCLSLAAGGMLFLLLTLPLLTLTLRAISERGWETTSTGAVAQAITLSFVTTGVTALLTMLLGTPLAYSLATKRFPFSRVAEVFIELPIVLPPAVAGLALLLMFGRRGWLGSTLDDAGISLAFTTTAVVIAQLFVSAPFFIRSAQNGFAAVPAEIIQAARVDGASEWRLFREIMVPLAQRSLAAGLILSWARAMGEFGATILFAGSLQGRTQTMPLLIYNVVERDLGAAMWAGVILVIIALAALVISQFLRRGESLTII
ncbi:MAG TPA: ABC transporter permease [Candidatus Limnocylindrales bacterium]|nr:ABC transporter permease [Candidatus Limnocylindrales bacterium]